MKRNTVRKRRLPNCYPSHSKECLTERAVLLVSLRITSRQAVRSISVSRHFCDPFCPLYTDQNNNHESAWRCVVPVRSMYSIWAVVLRTESALQHPVVHAPHCIPLVKKEYLKVHVLAHHGTRIFGKNHCSSVPWKFLFPFLLAFINGHFMLLLAHDLTFLKGCTTILCKGS